MTIINKACPYYYEKFERLKQYFGDLDEEDLSYLNLFEYIEFAAGRDKGLMSVFVARYLEPYIQLYISNQDTLGMIDNDWKKFESLSFKDERK